MRKRIYTLIEPAQDGNKVSLAYDILMLIAITASIIPLMFVEENATFLIIEQVTVAFLLSIIYCAGAQPITGFRKNNGHLYYIHSLPGPSLICCRFSLG